MSERHPSYARLMAAVGALEPPISGSTALANAIGEAVATVTNWGARGVSMRGAAKVQSALGVSTTWTLEGIEPMFVGPVNSEAGRPKAQQAPPVSAPATTPGYVRLGVIGEGGMGMPVENMDFPEVIREMQFSEVQLRAIFGFLPRPGRVALMTGRGHSMEPLISPGDVVMVDTQVTYYDEAGPYVINLGDGQQIKTLQHRGDGVYVVSLNEKVGGPPFLAPEDMLIGGKVYVVQKFVMAH